MNTISKKTLAVIFLLLIFIVGIGTGWNVWQAETGFSKAEGFKDLKTKIEGQISSNFQNKYGWVSINGLFERMMGVTVVRDPDYNVNKLSNGQIMYDLPERDMTKYAGYVEELNDALTDMDIDFMYVQIPFKIKDDSYMPPGTHANGYENADQMVQLLREKGIDTLDLRDDIKEQNLDWSSLFFNTDHHWTPQTAFWAAGVIMKRIQKDYGFSIDEDAYDESNWKLKTYENYMLGAIGRRTGVFYGGLDDFTLYDPKFKTDFTFWGSSKNGEDVREGDFWNSMYLWENMEKRADFEKNTYNTYLGKEYGLFEIQNHRSDNGLRILMIRESFSDALAPFIAVGADEVLGVDLRKYNKKSIPELCEEYDIDLVMIDYNPSAFSKNQFDFFDRGW